MKDLIISETGKIFSKAIKRYAEAKGLEEKQVSIALCLDHDQVAYFYAVDNTNMDSATILNILGVRVMDLKGYSVIVPPYIKGFLEAFEAEYPKGKVEVTVHLDRENDENIDLFLWVNNNLIKKLDLSELINI